MGCQIYSKINRRLVKVITNSQLTRLLTCFKRENAGFKLEKEYIYDVLKHLSKYLLTALVINTCCFSCKKDQDVTAPKITLSSPVENQSFSVYDYVPVAATVTDETKIAAVSITLLDFDHNPVHVTIPLSVSASPMSINFQYLLDNIHLENGLYFIMITASDGEHDAHIYRQIYISAVPKALKKVCMVSNPFPSQTNFSFIDSAFSGTTLFRSFSGDHLGSGVSSYHQVAYVCGNYTGNFTGQYIPLNTTEFTFAPVISSAPYFTGFFNDEQHCYIGRYDGAIRGYDHSGSVSFTASASSGDYPPHICTNADRLIVEQQDKTSSSKKLAVYFDAGGMEQSCNLSQDVVQLCVKDNTNVFLFGNTGGQGTIQLYDRIANNLWNPYPFSLASGAILSALKIDADTYLIGHSNGTIYKYEYSVNSVTAFLPGYTAVKLKMDALSNVLYIAEANKVSTLTYPGLVPMNSITTAETVRDIHLLYNR